MLKIRIKVQILQLRGTADENLCKSLEKNPSVLYCICNFYHRSPELLKQAIYDVRITFLGAIFSRLNISLSYFS